MNSLIKLFALGLLPVFFAACYADNSKPPQFKDGGNTIGELQSKYKCEEIEFENWEDDDKDDSTLTICLINSKALPSNPPDGSGSEFEKIASQVKHSLLKPEQYKSYYVIFVERKQHQGMQTRSHTMGSDIDANGL